MELFEALRDHFSENNEWQETGLRFLPEWNDFVKPPVLIASGVIYVIVFVSLYYAMRNFEPMVLRTPMRVYNLAQVGLCLYMSYGLLLELLAAPALEPLFGVIPLPNLFGLNRSFSASGEYFILVHYFSKFLDFFDTLFIVLRKKERQFSFLHVYHHATIGPIWGLLLHLGCGGGTGVYGAWINSMTHVIMYSHYFVTSFGIDNPYKKYITTWQIGQFYSCLLHAFVGATSLERVFPRYLVLLQMVYHLTMVALFTSFYKRTFKAKAEQSKKQDAPAAVAEPSTCTNSVSANNEPVRPVRRRLKPEQ